MILCGIDEAGKGPVLGDLVICGVAVDEDGLKKLEKLKIRDSKLMSKKERENLYNPILKCLKDYVVISISPAEIDAALNSPTSNLNILENQKTIQILNQLNPDKAIIDCPDTVIDRYKENIRKMLNKDMELQVEHKAEKYKVVAAASVIAKVLRDRKMQELINIHRVEFGSGYCSDPLTKKFMDENWQSDIFSHIIRKSWMTFKKLKIKNEQKSLFEW